jgi:hypothetical protein
MRRTTAGRPGRSRPRRRTWRCRGRRSSAQHSAQPAPHVSPLYRSCSLSAQSGCAGAQRVQAVSWRAFCESAGPPASGKRAACKQRALACRGRMAVVSNSASVFSTESRTASTRACMAHRSGAALQAVPPRRPVLRRYAQCAAPRFPGLALPAKRAWRRLRLRPLAWRMRRRGLRRCWRRKDRSRPSRHAPPRPALPPRMARLVASCGSRAARVRSRSARAALRGTSQEGSR